MHSFKKVPQSLHWVAWFSATRDLSVFGNFRQGFYPCLHRDVCLSCWYEEVRHGFFSSYGNQYFSSAPSALQATRASGLPMESLERLVVVHSHAMTRIFLWGSLVLSKSIHKRTALRVGGQSRKIDRRWVDSVLAWRDCFVMRLSCMFHSYSKVSLPLQPFCHIDVSFLELRVLWIKNMYMTLVTLMSFHITWLREHLFGKVLVQIHPRIIFIVRHLSCGFARLLAGSLK